MSIANLMGFLSLQGQSKFEGLTLFRDVNQERVDAVLVTVAHQHWPTEDAYMGFTNITLRDTASVIWNQWGNKKRHFKVLCLLGDC